LLVQGAEDLKLRLSFAKTIAAAVSVLALATGPAAAQTPASGQGRIVSLTGSLSVKHENLASRALAVNETVGVGDELATDAQSEAVIQQSDGSTIHIFPDSRVIFNDQSFGITEFLHLFFGSIKVHIEKLSGRPNPHSMTTPTAVIAVRGSTFSVFVDDTDATLVAVDEGMVAVANRRAPSDEVLLQPGQRTWVRGSQPPLRAQAFRGRSERADMMAGSQAMGGMAGNAMNGAGMAGAMEGASGTALSGRMPGTAGMSGRPGSPH
jgi:ferric-dicitrate binding protein FerR (iron transport regulator)